MPEQLLPLFCTLRVTQERVVGLKRILLAAGTGHAIGCRAAQTYNLMLIARSEADVIVLPPAVSACPCLWQQKGAALVSAVLQLTALKLQLQRLARSPPVGHRRPVSR